MIQRPYENLGEYYNDLGKKNREASDSTLLDKPQFKTRGGRVVYGGGGIIPDVFSKPQTDFNKSTNTILFHPDRLLFKYSELIKLQIQSKFTNYNRFTNLTLKKSYLI